MPPKLQRCWFRIVNVAPPQSLTLTMQRQGASNDKPQFTALQWSDSDDTQLLAGTYTAVISNTGGGKGLSKTLSLQAGRYYSLYVFADTSGNGGGYRMQLEEDSNWSGVSASVRLAHAAPAKTAQHNVGVQLTYSDGVQGDPEVKHLLGSNEDAALAYNEATKYHSLTVFNRSTYSVKLQYTKPPASGASADTGSFNLQLAKGERWTLFLVPHLDAGRAAEGEVQVWPVQDDTELVVEDGMDSALGIRWLDATSKPDSGQGVQEEWGGEACDFDGSGCGSREVAPRQPTDHAGGADHTGASKRAILPAIRPPATVYLCLYLSVPELCLVSLSFICSLAHHA